MSQGHRQQGGAPSRDSASTTTKTTQAMAMCAPPAPKQPRIVISDWIAREANTLRGFFCVHDNETGVVLHECSLHFGETNEWIGLPCAPKVYDNQVVRANGRVQYRNLIKITPRERWEQFQAAVLEALQAHPDAGRCWS